MSTTCHFFSLDFHPLLSVYMVSRLCVIPEHVYIIVTITSGFFFFARDLFPTSNPIGSTCDTVYSFYHVGESPIHSVITAVTPVVRMWFRPSYPRPSLIFATSANSDSLSVRPKQGGGGGVCTWRRVIPVHLSLVVGSTLAFVRPKTSKTLLVVQQHFCIVFSNGYPRPRFRSGELLYSIALICSQQLLSAQQSCR